MPSNDQQRVFVAGHRGMVGSAIVRRLAQDPGIELIVRSSAELDLTDQAAVRAFFADMQIDQVYMAAAKVGGIHANHTYPAEFIYQNLMIEANVIHEAWRAGVNRLLFLGSSCIYPKHATQPMTEAALLTGVLEETNEPYAIAKIAGIKLCESYHRQYGADYRSLMPTNLYGPGDNFHPENSHVIPALMRRFHEAKLSGVSHTRLWGSGQARREFLHVDDLAAASVRVMNVPRDTYWAVASPRCSHLNVGCGIDLPVRELAEIIAEVVGFDGELEHDLTKPDGTPRKLLSIDKLASFGWRPEIPLKSGLASTYAWFLANGDRARTGG
ncbi:GDP-fucose synthetase [Pandoraea terrae]|uniref:GDP-L-fucose synthase n=1 Tax=Pandoraea terrae TaxID=1537710 RepID=A0A5E4UUZ9_9BURK|nr:GDP-L-fucose synthase [Pandoraea terrae]VVE02290.1 GDP-fucose synthetase [Pandoraea terrae]